MVGMEFSGRFSPIDLEPGVTLRTNLSRRPAASISCCCNHRLGHQRGYGPRYAPRRCFCPLAFVMRRWIWDQLWKGLWTSKGHLGKYWMFGKNFETHIGGMLAFERLKPKVNLGCFELLAFLEGPHGLLFIFFSICTAWLCVAGRRRARERLARSCLPW